MGAEELVAAAAQAAGPIEGDDLAGWAAKVRAAATAQVLVVADMARLAEQLASPELKLWVRKITKVEKVGPSFTVYVDSPMESRAPGGQVTENYDIRTDYWDRPQTMQLKRVAEACIGRWAILYQCNDHEGENAPAQGHRRVVHIEPLPRRGDQGRQPAPGQERRRSAQTAPASPLGIASDGLPANPEFDVDPEPAPAAAEPSPAKIDTAAIGAWYAKLRGQPKTEVDAWLARNGTDLASLTEQQAKGLRALHEKFKRDAQRAQQSGPAPVFDEHAYVDELAAAYGHGITRVVARFLRDHGVESLAEVPEPTRQALHDWFDTLTDEAAARAIADAVDQPPLPVGPLDDLLATLEGEDDAQALDDLPLEMGVRTAWQQVWTRLGRDAQAKLRNIAKRAANKDELAGSIVHPETVGDLRTINPWMAEALAGQDAGRAA